MFDKYSVIIAIACVIGFSIMMYHDRTQDDRLLWLLIIPIIMFFYVKHLLKKDGFR
jgi:type II secretory pathway component PulF